MSGLRGITVSRPCLEGAVRRRVKALPNVELVEGADGVGPIYDPATQRVTGFILRHRDRGVDETLRADLVIDASGRGSRSPKWLEDWGFGEPEEVRVRVDVGYATRVFQRSPGEFYDSMGGVVSGTPPESTRYAAVLAAEGDRWRKRFRCASYTIW
jgi:2-polyprenyl-6-methoxyphenol hydroxylase-like FAD-dependent oxidoreductase